MEPCIDDCPLRRAPAQGAMPDLASLARLESATAEPETRRLDGDICQEPLVERFFSIPTKRAQI